MNILVQCKNYESLKEDSILDLTPFGACYVKVTPGQVANYKMVIIEPDFYSKAEITALKNTNTTILAYFTLGEVDRYRWYYPILEKIGFKGINENWDSPYLDLESDETKSLLLDRVLKEIMAKGVDGVFLDTVDAVAPYTANNYMQSHMADVIRGIRLRYPDIIIMQNAGLFLLEETRAVIDAVLIEDIASGYNFDKKDYFIKSSVEYNNRVELVRSTSEKYDIPVFIIDFAEEEVSREKLKTRLDTLGYPYFISNILLNQLPSNPSSVTNIINSKSGYK